jgi:hypothetical protein
VKVKRQIVKMQMTDDLRKARAIEPEVRKRPSTFGAVIDLKKAATIKAWLEGDPIEIARSLLFRWGYRLDCDIYMRCGIPEAIASGWDSSGTSCDPARLFWVQY